ncbi:hypothetical protein HAX54_047881, partial [Datura stramonium]|nr:hypothetical protein [Datura stramonium]
DPSGEKREEDGDSSLEDMGGESSAEKGSKSPAKDSSTANEETEASVASPSSRVQPAHPAELEQSTESLNKRSNESSYDLTTHYVQSSAEIQNKRKVLRVLMEGSTSHHET